MEIKFCGMTLEEIEEKFKEYDAIREKNLEEYANNQTPDTPKPARFAPDEDYDLAHEIYDDVQRYCTEHLAEAIAARDNAADNPEGMAVYDEYMRVDYIRRRCKFRVEGDD